MMIYKATLAILFMTTLSTLSIKEVRGQQFDPQEKVLISCSSCDYIIEPRHYKIDNNKLKLPPGAVLGIRGQNRNGVYLINFHGTKEKPYKVVNCDGLVTITNGLVGIKIHESSHIRVTGTGSHDTYGIKITTTLHGVQAEHGATDFEIDHIEISGPSASGLAARSNAAPTTNRSNFVQRNTVIHDNYVHDTGTEGLYIGGSHWHTSVKGLREPELIGVQIYNNKVENTGYDGIQVGSAIEDTRIYNNVIVNYGLKNSTYHQAGIQINPGTTGRIYNNFIKGGTGVAIFLSGFGNDVFNNLIVDCNNYGMYLADRNPIANQSYRIVNNTFVNIKKAAVKMVSRESINNVFYNNLLVNVAESVEKSIDMDLDVANNFETSTLHPQDLFVDADNLDFTPKKNSPLIDKGKDILDDLSIRIDYFRNNRLTGEAIDIGACEFQQ